MQLLVTGLLKANVTLSHSGRSNHNSRTTEIALPSATNSPTQEQATREESSHDPTDKSVTTANIY